MTAVAVLSVRAAEELTDEPEETGAEKLAGAEIIEKARKLYGKDYVDFYGRSQHGISYDKLAELSESSFYTSLIEVLSITVYKSSLSSLC